MSNAQITYRRAEEGDVREAFALFRRSLFEALARRGVITADDAANPPIEADWARQGTFVRHFAGHAAEHWVALGDRGRIVGWALSIEREGVFQLVFFFVDPNAQATGIGRGLLERAFPLGRGDVRVIMATGHERALGLYLRFGVHGAGSSLSVYGEPKPVALQTDLEFERVGRDDRAVDAIARIERDLLGHARVPEIEFLLEDRPAWLARRGGEAVAFAFGSTGDDTGPMGAVDPADIPALLGHVETHAHAAGHEEIWFSAPMANRHAVEHLLGRGYRIFPFPIFELASEALPGLARWVHTSPEFIL